MPNKLISGEKIVQNESGEGVINTPIEILNQLFEMIDGVSIQIGKVDENADFSSKNFSIKRIRKQTHLENAESELSIDAVEYQSKKIRTSSINDENIQIIISQGFEYEELPQLIRNLGELALEDKIALAEFLDAIGNEYMSWAANLSQLYNKVRKYNKESAKIILRQARQFFSYGKSFLETKEINTENVYGLIYGNIEDIDGKRNFIDDEHKRVNLNRATEWERNVVLPDRKNLEFRLLEEFLSGNLNVKNEIDMIQSLVEILQKLVVVIDFANYFVHVDESEFNDHGFDKKKIKIKLKSLFERIDSKYISEIDKITKRLPSEGLISQDDFIELFKNVVTLINKDYPELNFSYIEKQNTALQRISYLVSKLHILRELKSINDENELERFISQLTGRSIKTRLEESLLEIIMSRGMEKILSASQISSDIMKNAILESERNGDWGILEDHLKKELEEKMRKLEEIKQRYEKKKNEIRNTENQEERAKLTDEISQIQLEAGKAINNIVFDERIFKYYAEKIPNSTESIKTFHKFGENTENENLYQVQCMTRGYLQYMMWKNIFGIEILGGFSTKHFIACIEFENGEIWSLDDYYPKKLDIKKSGRNTLGSKYKNIGTGVLDNFTLGSFKNIFLSAELSWMTEEYTLNIKTRLLASLKSNEIIGFEHPQFLKVLATLYADLEHYEEAEKYFLMACEKDGWKNLDYISDLSEFYCQTGNWDKGTRYQLLVLLEKGGWWEESTVENAFRVYLYFLKDPLGSIQILDEASNKVPEYRRTNRWALQYKEAREQLQN